MTAIHATRRKKESDCAQGSTRQEVARMHFSGVSQNLEMGWKWIGNWLEMDF